MTIQQAIREILTTKMKRIDLLKALQSRGFDVDDRKMRLTIASMPDIGSSNAIGYYPIKTDDDYQACMRDLKSKAKSIYERADRITNHYTQGKTLEFDFYKN